MRRAPMRRMGRSLSRGMTLLEIMVVVVIMGIIAGVVTKVVVDKVERARVTKARIEVATLRDAVDLFYVDQSFYPASLEDLVRKPEDPRIKEWPTRGYMPSIPRDPWNNEYLYVLPGESHAFDVICLGADGVEGGEGPDADINSWDIAGAVEAP